MHLFCDLIRESLNDELARFFVSKYVKKRIPKITALVLLGKDKGVYVQWFTNEQKILTDSSILLFISITLKSIQIE